MATQTIARFTGPMRAVHATTVENSGPSVKKSAPRKVLVVDDEPLICWSIAETLGDFGYEVTQAHDAASAFRLLLAVDSGVDLVILDLNLPDAGELRVLTALRGFLPTLPVIVMTAHGSPELTRRAHNEGAFALIDKPFEMSVVPPLVEGALVT